MPRKLTLEPESLSIESFESGKAADGQGTVEAHVKVPCLISAGAPLSCPNTWDCFADDAPPPARA
jgi:hypothetical protein